jgi:hypothetical protein
MSQIRLKIGDNATKHNINIIENLVPIPLNNVSAYIQVSDFIKKEFLFTKEISIFNEEKGIVSITFNSDDFSQAGLYKAEIVLNFQDYGTTKIYPSNDYIELDVLKPIRLPEENSNIEDGGTFLSEYSGYVLDGGSFVVEFEEDLDGGAF